MRTCDINEFENNDLSHLWPVARQPACRPNYLQPINSHELQNLRDALARGHVPPDLTASLQERSRSYLDANCVQCHQPGGVGPTFDARYDTPLANQHITNYPAAFSLGYDNACVVKSRDIWRSVLLYRINTTNPDIQMPDFGNLIDTNAVQVISDWINSLPGTPVLAPPTFTPNGGSYIASVNVTLRSPDTNATIYYTLDGSLPTTNSFLYSGAFNLFSNATVAASAYKTNFDNSVAASALFSCNHCISPRRVSCRTSSSNWDLSGWPEAFMCCRRPPISRHGRQSAPIAQRAICSIWWIPRQRIFRIASIVFSNNEPTTKNPVVEEKWIHFN